MATFIDVKPVYITCSCGRIVRVCCVMLIANSHYMISMGKNEGKRNLYSMNIVENTNHSPSAKQTHAIKYIIDILGFMQTNVIFVRKFAIEH